MLPSKEVVVLGCSLVVTFSGLLWELEPCVGLS